LTIQLPDIEVSPPSLQKDSYNQKNTDDSFNEKLSYEKARLGLLFSPFGMIENIFSPTLSSNQSQNDNYLIESLFKDPSNAPNYAENTNGTNARSTSQASNNSANNAQIFDSLPLQSINRQAIQDLLVKTNWVIPNLAANPLFNQALMNGKLQQSFSLDQLVDQIISQIKIAKIKGETSVSFNLNPEELGNIILTLTYHAGMVSIQMQSSSDTKKLLDDNQEELENALRKADVHYDKIQVMEVKENV